MNLEKIIELLNSIKNNPTAIIGIVFASIGTIASGSYYLITKGNEVNSIITSYDETAGQAASALRKVETLTERVNAQQEAIIKLQERTSEALLNAREAKIVAESTQKEARAAAHASKVELEVTSQSLKSEMNTLKRATTNRLGN